MTDTGIYIHWPFCHRICPYCDFNVARSRGVDVGRWREAFLDDIDHWAERLGRRPLKSVYFGGGTPSLMPPGLVADLLDRLADRFALPNDAEITLESNPTDGEEATFAAFRDAGVNRLSLGVQSFDDDQLAFLGRNHNAGEARRAVDRAMALFPSVTIDQIYALPDETPTAWEGRLRAVLAMGVTHLSLYQLTIEPGTAFYNAVARRDWAPVDEDLSADLFEETQAVMEEAGLPAYEVSNHARSGAEAVHNALYWKAADWVGIGPGAHGRLTIEGQRFSTVGMPKISRFSDSLQGDRYTEEPLSASEQLVELLAGSLRQVAGLPLTSLQAGNLSQLRPTIDRLASEGLIDVSSERVCIPQARRLLTDHIVGRLCEAV